MKRIFILIIAIAACANPQYPSGGPVDTIPPEIIATSVESGRTNFKGNEIRFIFSEYMKKPTVQQSLYFSPQVKKYELKWGGEELTISIGDTLKANTTYVITIGSGASDYRNGNNMSASFQLAFSTGAKIDSGRIAGQVLDRDKVRPVQGAVAMAYDMKNRDKEPDPATDEADYYVQTDKNGRFQFNFIRESDYRVLVIDDANKDQRWNVANEAMATGFQGTIQASQSPRLQSWILFKQDVIPPTMLTVLTPGKKWLLVTFSEHLDTANHFLTFKLTSTDGKTETEVPWFYHPENPARVFLQPAELTDGDWQLVHGGSVDLAGNESEPDTLSFLVNLSDRDETVVDIFPSDSSMIIPFNQPIRFLTGSPLSIQSAWERSGLVEGLEVASSGGLDHQVSVSGGWPAASRLGIHALFSNGDTARIVFKTIDPSQFGDLSIESFSNGTEMSGSGILTLIPQSHKQFIAPVEFRQFPVSIENIPAGRYHLTGFIDQDDDGKWSAGRVVPWAASEPVFTITDTLRIRARWMLEDVQLHLFDN